jgi:molybdopterin/thiamine biosynthesis adenylyltransferase
MDCIVWRRGIPVQTNNILAPSQTANLTDERFQRHTLIPDWNQKCLAEATVIVIGMGALGNEVARILAMSGIGRLIICDPDTIEESNLSRMALFRQSDIGHLKVEAAADTLHSLAPTLIVETRPTLLTQGVGLAELRDANLVISCLDSRSARLQLASRCNLVKAPYLDGGTHPWGGEVRPYFDSDGPCFGCSLNVHDRATADVPWSCLDESEPGRVGAAIPSSALIGVWMGMLAVRYLMHLPTPSETLRISGSAGSVSTVEQVRDPNCLLHSPLPLKNIQKIEVGHQDTVATLRRALSAEAMPILWTPVQNARVCSTCKFSDTVWGLPAIAVCPRCGGVLQPRTIMELDGTPDMLSLAALGIPPREILTMRVGEELRFVELQS